VRKPRLFLLDEPLSNLDAKLRLETRVELRKLQRALGVTAVYVTHDQEEAMTIADRVAVFMDGRIVQVGRPQDIFARPATSVEAAFIGSPPMNLLPGEVRGGALRVAGVDVPGSRVAGADRAVTVGVRPAALRIAASGLAARVYLVENLGDTTIVDLDVGGRVIKLRAEQAPGVREGDAVHVAFASDALHVFDAESGARLTSGSEQ
jgi:ABC-type sugar transport system ATPase subunit